MICVIAGIIVVMGSDTSLTYGNAVCAIIISGKYANADCLDYWISFCWPGIHHFGCELFGLPTPIIEAGRCCRFHLVVYDHCKFVWPSLHVCVAHDDRSFGYSTLVPHPKQATAGQSTRSH